MRDTLTVREAIAEARRLGIPVVESYGSHILLWPKGERPVTLRRCDMNQLASAKARSMFKRWRKRSQPT